MRILWKAVHYFLTVHSIFIISLEDNTEHDFTPEGCWTNCSESACHYWPCDFFFQRIWCSGGERQEEKWLSFFPVADEVFWIPMVWKVSFSHEIISHLSFSITSTSRQSPVFINFISEKCTALSPLFPSFAYTLPSLVLSKMLRCTGFHRVPTEWTRTSMLACTSVFIS